MREERDKMDHCYYRTRNAIEAYLGGKEKNNQLSRIRFD